jgi:hypothetical protein
MMTRIHAFYNPDTNLADIVTFTPNEEAAADAAEALALIPTSAVINTERDRRVAAGFVFGGKLYGSSSEDQKRISGATQMAFMALVAGAQSGDLLWHGGTVPFAWIAHDNSMTVMDAQTVIAFGKAAAAWEQAHIFAARALKDATPIPANWKDNAWWPS